jgi:competence protein ComEC
MKSENCRFNANSIVLMVEYCGHRIILPGDLESPGLDRLLAGQPVHCDVLLAPHHGSRQSNSPGLAAWTRPAWVVLSGDGRWSLPEIDATYQAVGGQTIHTFLAGAVEVTIDKNGTRVETFLPSIAQ